LGREVVIETAQNPDLGQSLIIQGDGSQSVRHGPGSLGDDRRAASVQIRGPADLTTGRDLRGRVNELGQRGLVVLDPFREQHCSWLIDHALLPESIPAHTVGMSCPFDQLLIS
jgi:hypothetical protein